MVDATDPFIPTPIYRQTSEQVKAARPDIIIEDEPLSFDTMTDYIFAEIGAQEIVSSSRNDLIDSPYATQYSLLADAGPNFDNQQSLAFSNSEQSILQNYAINLNDHIPLEGLNFPTFSTGIVSLPDTIGTDGTLTFDVRNLSEDYLIDIYFIGTTDALDGTIYTEDGY